MKKRDKPHPPLSSPTDLMIPSNRRLANLQEKKDKMTYIDFHFTTLSQQSNSLNGFLLSPSTPEPQLALPIVAPPLNRSYTFLNEPVKQIDTGSLMSLPSRQAKVLPKSQPSASTEEVSSFFQKFLTGLMKVLSPKLSISFELKHKDLKLRFKATSK
ncbi:hypothetical protein [Laspinema olomoucense]|uniref:hypothetical protein n=1 Tax=Laspinema olomoucense TaxID=3231600 RepID=UPI0021BB6F94|nr:hypothetical protein [Laspinema sp. D3d]MCT7971075.1 hypothetical protein [Laspinema sp. D3d]